MSKPQREDMVKWVKALRSSEYTQAREALITEGTGGSCSYCCLGVLAVVLGAEVVEDDDDDDEEEEEGFRVRLKLDGAIVDDMGYVGEQIINSFGRNISEYLGGLEVATISHLIHMNDDDGNSFDEIADYIEEVLV